MSKNVKKKSVRSFQVGVHFHPDHSPDTFINVLLRAKSDSFCSIHISKQQVRIISHAKIQVKIPTGSLIILSAIFEIGLPPLLNSKMTETPS